MYIKFIKLLLFINVIVLLSLFRPVAPYMYNIAKYVTFATFFTIAINEALSKKYYLFFVAIVILFLYNPFQPIFLYKKIYWLILDIGICFYNLFLFCYYSIKINRS